MSAQGDGFWKQRRQDTACLVQMARRQAGGASSFIHREVQARMLERSEVMRPPVGGVLDVSLGDDNASAMLAGRFAGQTLTSVRWLHSSQSPAVPAVQRFLKRLGIGRVDAPGSIRKQVVQSLPGLTALPTGQSMVWSNGLLHRLPDPVGALRQFRQTLVPGGALFFSCLGPDTALELRACAQDAGVLFPDFADMHDWGDLLLKAGFSDPVMEMERITLTYTEPSRLLQDWHELEGNPLSDRFKGLRGRGFYDGLCKFLQIRGGGRLQLTLEILYGHAWAVDRPMKSGEVSIPVSQIRRKP